MSCEAPQSFSARHSSPSSQLCTYVRQKLWRQCKRLCSCRDSLHEGARIDWNSKGGGKQGCTEQPRRLTTTLLSEFCPGLLARARRRAVAAPLAGGAQERAKRQQHQRIYPNMCSLLTLLPGLRQRLHMSTPPATRRSGFGLLWVCICMRVYSRRHPRDSNVTGPINTKLSKQRSMQARKHLRCFKPGHCVCRQITKCLCSNRLATGASLP